MEQNIISEEELLDSIKKAEEEYITKETITAKSIRELLQLDHDYHSSKRNTKKC